MFGGREFADEPMKSPNTYHFLFRDINDASPLLLLQLSYHVYNRRHCRLPVVSRISFPLYLELMGLSAVMTPQCSLEA